MNWDNISLIILAAFGCLTLLLAQVSEVLSKLPQIIRAWRQVRQELNTDTDNRCPRPPANTFGRRVSDPPGPPDGGRRSTRNSPSPPAG